MIDQAGQCGIACRQRPQVLRRHVGHRATEGRRDLAIAGVLGEVEVQQHGLPVGGEQHIRGLDVSMEHAAIMGMLESFRQPRNDPDGSLDVAAGT